MRSKNILLFLGDKTNSGGKGGMELGQWQWQETPDPYKKARPERSDHNRRGAIHDPGVRASKKMGPSELAESDMTE